MPSAQRVKPLRIVVGSAGRRVYIVDWFRDAFKRLGVDGEVHVTDADARSAAYLSSTHRHLVPPYGDAAYATAMIDLFDLIEPRLFVSLNDYELAVLAMSGLAQRLEERGTTVLVPRGSIHASLHDKYQMYGALTEARVPTVETVLASDNLGIARLTAREPNLIIKDRYGSGSSGLVHVPSSELELALRWVSRPSAGKDPSSFVVQPALEGSEFGLDVVAPLTAGGHDVRVLARRKLRMRAGETDQAETVDPGPFNELALRLAAWTGHRGGIDVDLIGESPASAKVIDINPRFGGGYPFSHRAGADIPALIVDQLVRGRSDATAFLRYRVGTQSSKFEAITN
ncbi:ATP-grasp domain-containing protein [Microbacterium sp. NPDC089987]|uniref:ATP-grasp domain-containing protein n=1 Tax=Microbacterium sp. NPDC089987 TaxID=3364202 RepID=UPI0037FDBFFC